MITFKQSGNFNNTEAFFKRMLKPNYMQILESYGREGVTALASSTPRDTGETANAWTYDIYQQGKNFAIEWSNSKMAGRTPVAILLQYGHGTRNGGYVKGIDYINPATQPIFENFAKTIWKEVIK